MRGKTMEMRLFTGGKQKTLLIADDEPNIRLVVKRVFEKDYRVLEAANGDEAVKLAFKDRPDIILMDIMMPGSDGLNALNILKNDKRTSDIPVIMLTGLGFNLNQQLAGSLGAREYLKKPIAVRDLVGAVNKTY
jgi:two-component system, OmpR family, alkaline phosphatase synthesis response regulator PhoP